MIVLRLRLTLHRAPLLSEHRTCTTVEYNVRIQCVPCTCTECTIQYYGSFSSTSTGTCTEELEYNHSCNLQPPTKTGRCVLTRDVSRNLWDAQMRHKFVQNVSFWIFLRRVLSEIDWTRLGDSPNVLYSGLWLAISQSIAKLFRYRLCRSFSIYFNHPSSTCCTVEHIHTHILKQTHTVNTRARARDRTEETI